MDDTIEKGAGGQNDLSPGQFIPVGKSDSMNPAAIVQNRSDLAKNNLQPVLSINHLLRGTSIKRAIRLGTGSLHGRPFAAVQQSKLDPGLIRQPPHDTVQGIDFTNQMPLSQAPNCRIARHGSQIVTAQRDQRGVGPHARGYHRGLNARMPATNNNHIVMFHVKPLFPDAE